MITHIILKLQLTYSSNKDDIIDEHMKILKNKGKVWWAKFGKGISEKKYKILKIQIKKQVPTHAYLGEGGRVRYRARIIDIARVPRPTSVNIPCPEPELVPLYYRRESHKVWFKFDELVMLGENFDINMDYEKHDDKDISLSGQGSLIYIKPKIN